MNLGGPSAAGFADGLNPFFDKCPSAVRMHLDDGRIEGESFHLDAHNLLQLEFLEDAVQNTILGSPVHAHIDAVPIAELLGKPAPLAAMLGYIQQSIQHCQICQAHVAAPHWQAGP